MNFFIECILLTFNLTSIFMMSLLRWIIPTKHKSVKDEVCLVTGAGSGIGRLLAFEFAKRGAVLILWDIDNIGNRETADMIEKIGGKVFFENCDVSDREEIYKMAQKARMEAGDVTILVNNAGIVYGKDFMEITDEEIEKTIKVNSLAHFWTVRAFLPRMLENNHGHIVTVASVLGLIPLPGMTEYIASKFASVGFNHGLELELRKYQKDGVKTTLACPHHTNTGMFSGITYRFPSLLKPLEPFECVESIMHAILTNRSMVVIPRSMYFSYNMSTWMPHAATLAISKFTGILKSMESFIPTRDYQKKAAKIE
ncbi:retinol dehydrogenase 10-like [Styela clava]